MKQLNNETLNTYRKYSSNDNSTDENFFLIRGVKKGIYSPIRIRFDTALRTNGKQWFEVYNKVGLRKAYASMIRNGHLIPPPSLRIKIATAIGVDTSVLWEAPDILSVDKLQKDEGKALINDEVGNGRH